MECEKWAKTQGTGECSISSLKRQETGDNLVRCREKVDRASPGEKVVQKPRAKQRSPPLGIYQKGKDSVQQRKTETIKHFIFIG